jgi:hypothetical protein
MPLEQAEVEKLLAAARAAVDAAKIPDDLRSIAFTKALDLMAGAGLAIAAPATPAPATPAAATLPPTGGPEKSLAKVAEKLVLPLEAVSEVFHIDGERLLLSVGTSKLESSSQAGAKQVTLLIAAGRQAGGWDDEWTATPAIRPVVESYGKFDGNYAKAIKAMDDDFSFSGSGAGRKLKVKRKGFENAAALIKKLAGEDDS